MMLLDFRAFTEMRPWVVFLFIIPLLIWESVWKGIGLWKAGRNDHSVWFICMFVFNTLGILPIIYMFGFSKKPKANIQQENQQQK
jgi:hypothetical protein